MPVTLDPQVLAEMRRNLTDPESVVQFINGIPRADWSSYLYQVHASVTRRYAWGDHRWAPDRCVCLDCGISALDFYQVKYGKGLPCLDAA